MRGSGTRTAQWRSAVKTDACEVTPIYAIRLARCCRWATFAYVSLTKESPVAGLGTEPITKFDRKGVYNWLVKGFFEERAKVIVMSIGQVTAARVDNE